MHKAQIDAIEEFSNRIVKSYYNGTLTDKKEILLVERVANLIFGHKACPNIRNRKKLKYRKGAL